MLLEGSVVRPKEQRYDNNKGFISMRGFSYSVLDSKGRGKEVHLGELIKQPSQNSHKSASLTSDTVVAVGPELYQELQASKETCNLDELETALRYENSNIPQSQAQPRNEYFGPLIWP